MKLAIVAEWLDPWRGGAETSTLQFVHHLLERDVELHLFTRSRPSSTPQMEVHTISGASMSRTRRSMTFAHRVEHALAHHAFDIIHAVSPCRVADVYQPRGGTVAESIERNLALRRGDTAQYLKRYANHFNFKQRYLLSQERQIMRNGAGPVVVALSDYVVRQLKEHYRLPDHRIRKVYNAIEAPNVQVEARDHDHRTIREEFGIKSSDCLVLTVAHNFRLKGVQRWMEALSLLLQRGVQDVRAIVIGKGDAPRWYALAKRLNLQNHLTFIGPSDRVRAFYHAADILVHPTYYDPCSRVVLEAMIAGLTCITTVWDGASEMIESGVNGFVLKDPWDIAGLAHYVEQACGASLRQRIGNAAQEIREQVNMKRHVDEMLQLYRELLTSRVR